MFHKYYVLVTEARKLEGPISFRQATIRKNEYDTFGEFTQILKIVVDETGKGVE